LISSGDGDASDDTSSPTGASAEPLDAALTSSTFSSAGESGLFGTTTVVEEAEAGSSDGTGSGTAALAQRQPEAKKKILANKALVRKRIREGGRDRLRPRAWRRRRSGTAVTGHAPLRRGAKGAAVAQAEAVVETQSSMLSTLFRVFPPLLSSLFLWRPTWLGFEVSVSREGEEDER